MIKINLASNVRGIIVDSGMGILFSLYRIVLVIYEFVLLHNHICCQLSPEYSGEIPRHIPSLSWCNLRSIYREVHKPLYIIAEPLAPPLNPPARKFRFGLDHIPLSFA